MRRRLIYCLLALLSAPLWGAVPTEIGTDTLDTSSGNRSSATPTHTVASGTTTVVVSINIEGNESVSSVVWDVAGVSEAFTVRADSGGTGSNGDVRSLIYTLDSPTAKTSTLTVTYGSTVNPDMVHILNLQDTSAWSGNASGAFSETGTGSFAVVMPLITVGANSTAVGTACIQGGDQTTAGGTGYTKWDDNEQTNTVTGASAAGDISFYSGYVDEGATTNWSGAWQGISSGDEHSSAVIEILGSSADIVGMPVIWIDP